MLQTVGQLAIEYTIPLLLCSSIITFVYEYIHKKHTLNINNIYIIISVYVILVTIAFLSLIILHILSDFSNTNVINNTHTKEPILYKIVGLWGNHEGSILLWIWILSIYTYTILFLRKIRIEKLRLVLMIQLCVNLFFSIYIQCTSNPFLQVTYRAFEGKELNPILQDVVLSIHPPLIYAGYIGLSVVMSITIANLLLNNKNFNSWLLYVRYYNLFSWSFLTIGIVLGSWWAYYELGWGGWWFWDPVENASLMPWIISTALLHSILATNKTKALTNWSILLSLGAFFSSILGTFFVRSGFLDSVHSFTSDSNRGMYILALLLIMLFSFGIIFKYYYRVNTYNINTILTKEGIIFINQFFFILFYIIVAIGTFYPIVYHYIFNKSITIGPSFYNQAIIPVTIPFLLLMVITMLVKWEIKCKTDTFVYYISRYWIHLLTLLSIISAVYSVYDGPTILYIFIIIFILYIYTLYKKNSIKKINLIDIFVSHVGFIIMTIGITVWYCFKKENHLVMLVGDSCKVGEYTYTFRGTNITKESNYDAFYGSYIISKENIVVGSLFPEKRHYIIQDFYASKVDIHSSFLYDIHAIIGDGNIYTGWATSIYVYPGISWIWIGGILITLGAPLTLYNTIKKKYMKNIAL